MSHLITIPEGKRLVLITEGMILQQAQALERERERQELRTAIHALYGKQAARVEPYDGEEYNDENDYESCDHVRVYDENDQLLAPDFSLPYWEPYKDLIADFTEQFGEPTRWGFMQKGDEEDEPSLWLRETMERYLWQATSMPWSELGRSYDLVPEPKDLHQLWYALEDIK